MPGSAMELGCLIREAWTGREAAGRMSKGSSGSSSSSSSSSSCSCSCSCRGVAVILLLCLTASTASGKTDAANAAELFGIGILIQRNPPPRTVMAVTELVPKELPGVAVNITCINSKCEDIPAYMAVSKFAAEGAIGVIGDICSRASVAAAGIANMRKIPIISPASTSPSLSETDFFFRTVPSDKFQGVTAANLVRKSGATVTALIYEDNAYGYGLAFNFIAGFTKERGTVPVTYQFKSGQGKPQAALADVVAGVRDKGVQAVFMSTNNLTFVADFLVAAKAANLSLPIFGGDALADYMLYEKLRGRPSLIGKLTTTSVSPGSKDYVRAFTNFTGGDAKTSYQAYAAHAYDAVAALLRAYKAAAAPKDGPAVKAALGKLDFPGVGGRVRFDVFGDLVPDNQTYVAVKFNSTTGARLVQGFVSK
ncbi:hypothetical protein OEZ86_008573 [Tetradesmus obliquus]|nr:hypothetical protein OEZ86_008573 [Tetradesmus obliquus]